ncbi:endoplasmic reticulum protein [Sanghuangporus baumii]|uniref:Endoplasmic reticulum protein n=1 Tax=Sanghuangporus baumii TaxID=108892 RepID=A0A9Q5HZ15_SANBA|nr:endoplasmic reticulum protein [Sanghuangporus baumii]
MLRLAIARRHVIATTLRPVNVARRRSLPLSYVRFNSSRSSQSSGPASKAEPFWNAPTIAYEQVKLRTEQPSPDAYLIDVREPDEVILGSIPSSVNLPLSVLADSLHLNPVAFKERHGFEKPKRNQEIVFYCRSGKRSATAADVAKKYGYSNVLNYEGSWLDWTAKEQGKSS